MNPRLRRSLDRAPLVVAAVFLVALLVSLGSVLDSLDSHADFVSTPVMAQGVPNAQPGSVMILGDYRWLEALWLLRATAWLPGHFTIWEATPFVLWLVLIACASWAVLRATGSRWAASITGAMLFCPGVDLRQTLWSLNTHGPAAVHVAIIGAAAIAALRLPRWRRGLRGYGAALVIGLVSALGATDPLVAPLTVAPLMLVALVMWLRRGDAALLRLAVVVVVVELVGAHFLVEAATHAGFSYSGRTVSWIDADGVLKHLGWLPATLTFLTTNNVYGSEVDGASTPAMIGGLVALAALSAVLWAGVRASVRDLWPNRFAMAVAGAPAWTPSLTTPGGSPPAGPKSSPDQDRLNARDGLVVFWLAVLVVNLVLWVFTGAPESPESGRYLVSGWVAVCVLVPVIALRLDVRWLGSLTALAVCLASTIVFIHQPRSNAGAHMPSAATAKQLAAFAASYGVHHGYGAYWDAAPITWHTRFGLQVAPLKPCDAKELAGTNCRVPEHIIGSWYNPHPGRSLIFSDSGLANQPIWDSRYGTPVATKTFGTITAYVLAKDPAPLIGWW